MDRAELRDAIDVHPKVLGWKMDGSDIWACCDSGNLTVHLSAYEKRKAEKDWNTAVALAAQQDLDYPDRPTNREVLRHPTLAATCNGLECKHVPLENVQRSTRVLRLILETLQQAEG